MDVNSGRMSYDFIMVKFGYGTLDKKKSGSNLRTDYYKEDFTIDWTVYYRSQLESKIAKMKKKLIDEENDLKRDKISKELIKDKQKLQRSLYKDNEKGTTWHKIIVYKHLMRTTGKAKEGDCLFISKRLFKIANEYITMNISFPEEFSNIVGLGAYQALTCANMYSSINLPLKNILILEDKKYKALCKAVSVKTKKVMKEINVVDYRSMETEANELGFTFYKKKLSSQDGFTLLNRDEKSAFNNGIELKYTMKNVGMVRKCIVERHKMPIKVNSIMWV